MRGKKKKEENFWADQISKQVFEKEKSLKRVKKLRTEMGLGASGIPHVGSTGDGIRSYVVSLALENLGANSEFIAFSDDRDGLRKVPFGFPNKLEKDLGKPVSLIKDPYGCHKSFGAHVSSLLIGSFKKLDVNFKIKKASEEYPKGTFDKEIIEILTNAEQAGRIIKKITGQDKYLTQLPFMPICEKCQRIYTTTAYKFNPKNQRISYKCDQDIEGTNTNSGKKIKINRCGYEGKCGIRDGKLAWKVEFAARWRALKINYEAYGKDILDSVKCNDVVCKELLGWEPPVHSFYEMFTERSGKKISKSEGNVFTPDMWMSYASPESLRLLFLKRLDTTRVVDLDAIPSYMDEVDELRKVYFREVKIENKKELAHLRRLFEFVNFLKPIKKSNLMIPYNMLVNIMKITKEKDIVKATLERTGHIPKKMSKEDNEELEKRLSYVENWIKDTNKIEISKAVLSKKQKKALKKLVKELKEKKWTEESLQTRLYDLAKEEEIPLKDFFKAAYLALLQNERGPRLAPFILAVGKAKIAKILEQVV